MNPVSKPNSCPKLLATMGAKYGVEPLKLLQALRETYFRCDPPLSTEEILSAIVVCNHHDLDPFLREVHVTRAKGNRLLIMVGVDGWIKKAHQSGKFDGMTTEVTFQDSEKLIPFCVTVEVFRKDQLHPIKVSAFYSEYKRDTEPWRQSPVRMLTHKAVKEGLRYAFGLSGIDSEDPDDIQQDSSGMRIMTMNSLPQPIKENGGEGEMEPVEEKQREPGQEG